MLEPTSWGVGLVSDVKKDQRYTGDALYRKKLRGEGGDMGSALPESRIINHRN